MLKPDSDGPISKMHQLCPGSENRH
jgi:hypothetical protein